MLAAPEDGPPLEPWLNLPSGCFEGDIRPYEAHIGLYWQYCGLIEAIIA